MNFSYHLTPYNLYNLYIVERNCMKAFAGRSTYLENLFIAVDNAEQSNKMELYTRTTNQPGSNKMVPDLTPAMTYFAFFLMFQRKKSCRTGILRCLRKDFHGHQSRRT
jgi:hypothetical protein